MGQETAGPFLLGVVNDLMGRPLLHHHAAIHEQDPVSHIPGKGHLMGDNDHGGLVGCKLSQHPQHFSGQLRVQGTGRLVKAKDIGLQSQGTCNGNALLLPTRKLVGIMAGTVAQSHLFQQAARLEFQFIVDLTAMGLVIRSLLRQ